MSVSKGDAKFLDVALELLETIQRVIEDTYSETLTPAEQNFRLGRLLREEYGERGHRLKVVTKYIREYRD
jgi:hypothetical protein